MQVITVIQSVSIGPLNVDTYLAETQSSSKNTYLLIIISLNYLVYPVTYLQTYSPFQNNVTNTTIYQHTTCQLTLLIFTQTQPSLTELFTHSLLYVLTRSILSENNIHASHSSNNMFSTYVLNLLLHKDNYLRIYTHKYTYNIRML